MLKGRGCIWAATLYSFFSVCTQAQILWKEPKPATISDWTWGPGGQELAPQPPFQFVKERMNGTNAKVEVQDAAGRHWTVKFGAEVHADTFAPRFLNVLGYAAEPTYYVAEGSITGVQGLKRAKYFISKDGSFHKARFKLRQKSADKSTDKSPDNKTWSWVDNPFTGSRELGGLKIMMMLASNWDAKDARDGEESNNEIIPARSGGSQAWYAVTDWGASFGVAGGFFKRTRWDWNGYRVQTPRFVRFASNGNIEWGFKGKHAGDITAGVGVDDIRWLAPRLSKITDEDLRAGLTASGASPAVAQEYTRLIRQRVLQLQQIADSSKVRRAAQ